MFFHCKLVALILVMTLDGQVYTGEIYGGHVAAPHSRPYMVLVEQHMENGTTKYCSGFILNEDFVMTAAHCQANSYKVLLGVHNFKKTNEIQNISVGESFPHKEYDPTGYKNDIMLLKLSSKANFNNNVRPIALAGQGDDSLPKSCIVSGWGRVSRSEKFMSDLLMEVNVTLIDSDQFAKEKLYCSEGETGPAEGDSGGPLVCEDGKAYGVVSFTFDPDLDGLPKHCYTKIPDNRSWIQSAMKTA
ncbi:granzyme B(G,H)-like [Xiphias gladius]|uniref:granzyme B(G,H)-like n=1 Tax=Xiphias gladius TaxID=8245 RepID=UPI001A99DC89|nr:granzyme B(G,H)-like [Xiphias gladius]